MIWKHAWKSKDDTVGAKLFLLIADKLVVGVVIAIALLIYNNYERRQVSVMMSHF